MAPNVVIYQTWCMYHFLIIIGSIYKGKTNWIK